MMKLSNIATASVLLIVAATSVGCRCSDGIFGVDQCADVPCGAIPNKPGSHLCEWQHAQVANASIDRGMFYQADFVGRSNRLGPSAMRRVGTLVQQGSIGTVALYVEPSDDSQRDMARVVSLASAVSSAGVPITLDQIQIAYSPAIGLEGFRAQQVARAASRGGQGGGQGNAQGGQGNNGGGFGGAAGGNGAGGGGIF